MKFITILISLVETLAFADSGPLIERSLETCPAEATDLVPEHQSSAEGRLEISTATAPSEKKRNFISAEFPSPFDTSSIFINPEHAKDEVKKSLQPEKSSKETEMKKEPVHAPEPTSTAVTPPAAHEQRH